MVFFLSTFSVEKKKIQNIFAAVFTSEFESADILPSEGTEGSYFVVIILLLYFGYNISRNI